MKQLLRVLVIVSLCLVASILPAHAAEQVAPVDREELGALLRDVLREHPDIVLDVLRDHSELVLDIAQQGSNQRRLKALSAQWRKELDVARPMSLGDRPVRGGKDAPVTIVAFSDFTCPYCTQAAGTLSQLLQDNAGKVRLVFKHFPLEGHRYARMAAEYHVAATFQGDNKAWAMYDVLFRLSKELTEQGEPVLKQAAEEAGLDMKKLQADLRGKAQQIRAIIDTDIADGKALGLQGTPNFLVNNLIIRGSLSSELFNQAIIMAYDHARKQR